MSIKEPVYILEIEFQSPLVGEFIAMQLYVNKEMLKAGLFQSPLNGEYIATLPSQNPLKHWGEDPEIANLDQRKN